VCIDAQLREEFAELDEIFIQPASRADRRCGGASRSASAGPWSMTDLRLAGSCLEAGPAACHDLAI